MPPEDHTVNLIKKVQSVKVHLLAHHTWNFRGPSLKVTLCIFPINDIDIMNIFIWNEKFILKLKLYIILYDKTWSYYNMYTRAAGGKIVTTLF